ncbi:vitamin K epoxide reductase family protein [Arcanobacterium phocae]|uniref:vitamin K epoxide reductase family protein n=1 Tax=Arcanobacterium phocae TaxID=131112 RepID=UPI001C0F1770|nr:vitamin K epoxide reductase family protein [Arcanobacterium phocae]
MKNQISELSEHDIDERIAKFACYPSERQVAGGAERGFAWLMTVCGVIGMWASMSLIIAEKQKLMHPEGVLPCDINPLVGCGKWVGMWQNEVFFGVTNSVFGLAFFAGITALGFVLVADGRFARWLWQALSAALALGIVWVVWFMYQSLVVENSMCPYCVVTWFTTIMLFVHVTARSAQAGHFGDKFADAGRAYARNRWIGVGLSYGLVIVLVVVFFWDQLPLFFV